jgi:hypothetical protein
VLWASDHAAAIRREAMVSSGPLSTQRDVMLVTHKVVIDADNAEHAARLAQMLRISDLRVYVEEHNLVSDDGKNYKREVKRV